MREPCRPGANIRNATECRKVAYRIWLISFAPAACMPPAMDVPMMDGALRRRGAAGASLTAGEAETPPILLEVRRARGVVGAKAVAEPMATTATTAVRAKWRPMAPDLRGRCP